MWDVACKSRHRFFDPKLVAEEIIENLEAGLNSIREVLVGLEKAS